MRILRTLLALIVLAYALVALAAGTAVAAFKARAWSPPADIAPAELDLMASISWVQIALWAAAIVLYLAVAVKLFRRVKSFLTWSAAFLLSVVNWVWLRASPAYDAATPPDLANVDYVVLGASLAIGALILALGRTHLD
jgi:hypothetical protein